MHGDGRVFRPTRDGKRLNVWYYEIGFRGRSKVGTGFRTRALALAALKEERKRKARGEFIAPEHERLTVGEILDSYLGDLRDRGKKSLPSVESRVGLLKESLGFRRAKDLATDHVEAYREDRLAAGRDRATIDREVEVLRAAFRLAGKRGRVERVPYFPMFNVDNVRQGFFEPGQTEAIEAELPPVLAEVVRFVSLSGWRIGEVLPLRWEQVDRNAREIRLSDSKNGKPRTLALRGLLWELVERCWKRREYSTRTSPALSAYLFHRRRGRPVSYSSYRKEFAAACARANVTDRTTHDFRRTVARDLRNAGVSETVAMSITGHETAEIFRRYSIVDTRDQEVALAAREALLESQESNLASIRRK
jgi:integrase